MAGKCYDIIVCDTLAMCVSMLSLGADCPLAGARLVMGDQLHFKALVGTASLEADESARPGGAAEDDWFAASRRPATTETSGALFLSKTVVYRASGLPETSLISSA